MNPFDCHIFHLVKHEIIVIRLCLSLYRQNNYVSISEIQKSSKTNNLDPRG